MPTSFTLEAAAKPAGAIANSPASLTAPPQPKKATDLIIEEGPRPPKSRRRQHSAECVVCIYPYSRDAATVWENCKQSGLMLWQVQLDHNARNSITIGFYESFKKFLQQEDDVPSTVQELAQQALIKLVLADTTDPDKVGFVRWRAAFYVAGEDVEACTI